MANHQSATYINGHQESVLRSHKWRTAENSAAYLLPHIKPGMRILDVGCGPGTISIDFAKRVGPQGSVVGVENSEDVIAEARATAAADARAPSASCTPANVCARPLAVSRCGATKKRYARATKCTRG